MHNVTLTFKLNEQVTPGIFAKRVAEACFQYGALRPDEAVQHPEISSLEFTYREGRGERS